MHCPRPDCKWMYFQNQIEDHCASRHGIKTGHIGAKALLSRIYIYFGGYFLNFQSLKFNVGTMHFFKCNVSKGNTLKRIFEKIYSLF